MKERTKGPRLQDPIETFKLNREVRIYGSTRIHCQSRLLSHAAVCCRADRGADPTGVALGGGSACWLAREAWGTWRFHGVRLPSSAAYHGMLVPDLAAYTCERQDPSATLRTGFLLLARTESEAPALHYRFLNRRVDLPLRPSWAEWLWKRGFSSGEIEALQAVGIHAYRCRPDPAQLEEDIGDAVRCGRLTVPEEQDLAEAA